MGLGLEFAVRGGVRDAQEEERRHEGIDGAVQGLDQDLCALVVPRKLKQP